MVTDWGELSVAALVSVPKSNVTVKPPWPTTAPVRTASKPPVTDVVTAEVGVMASTLTRARPGGRVSARIEPGETPCGTLIVTR